MRRTCFSLRKGKLYFRKRSWPRQHPGGSQASNPIQYASWSGSIVFWVVTQEKHRLIRVLHPIVNMQAQFGDLAVRVKMRAAGVALLGLVMGWGQVSAQAPQGPIAPKPGITVQQPPPEVEARLKVRVSLVNTPVTVRDARGQMIHDLDAKNFMVTVNGIAQKITRFDLGGDDPVSVVILMETSSRIDSIFSE